MFASLPDYYALLGVAADADREAIRAAYRALAKQHHPDLVGGEADPSADKFLRIQEAYDVLGDAERRAQYDLERARYEAIEEERRKQREFISRQAQGSAAGPATPLGPPRKLPARSVRLYFGALLFLAVVLGGIALQKHQRRLAAQQDQIIIVKVDEPRRPGAPAGSRSGEREAMAVPPSLNVLSKEVEVLSRLLAERAEAARSKTAPAPRTPPPPAPREQVSSVVDGKVDCTGEGRAFFVVRDNDNVSVSYNGGPLVRPRLYNAPTGMVVMSMVEPTNKISIGFLKGDKNGTVVLISDAVGNIFRTFGVECSAAAF